MKELVERIARALVDHPDQVQVRTVEESGITVLELPSLSKRNPDPARCGWGQTGQTSSARNN